MNQHTPGPWKVVNNRFTDTPTCVGAGDYGAIADTAGFRGAPAEDNANARLIAKAPEMFECLRLILDLADENAKGIDGYTQIVEWSRALLREIIEGEY